MKPRKLAWIAALMLLMGITAWLENQRILSGWFQGETFWQGRPTRYWLRELRAYQLAPAAPNFLRSIIPSEYRCSRFAFERDEPPALWIDFLRAYLPATISSGGVQQPQLPFGDDRAVKVLNEMHRELRESGDEEDRIRALLIEEQLEQPHRLLIVLPQVRRSVCLQVIVGNQTASR